MYPFAVDYVLNKDRPPTEPRIPIPFEDWVAWHCRYLLQHPDAMKHAFAV